MVDDFKDCQTVPELREKCYDMAFLVENLIFD